ncbi:MAG: CDP-alcohol phosphatidyltransferase [Actinobacteria bacterium]|nr:CDP-alcohol phosphatidyltransferase [Actinomycetota bacterium]
MLDQTVRPIIARPLDRAAQSLDRAGITPAGITAIGLGLGVAACVAVLVGAWWLAMGFWLLNRLADGLDGPLARRRGPTDLGGLFDLVSDFTVYAAIIVAMAIRVDDARMAAIFVLFAYYLSGTAGLAWSNLAARREIVGDSRAFIFPAGLAEGTETVIAYVVMFAFPSHLEALLWTWSAVVGVTAVQRVVYTHRLLK